MTRSKRQPLKNVPASVKAQLLSLARARSEEFNSLLTRYVLERFLYRLAISPHRDGFLLKGALLFTVWSQRPHRATKDIDLLGFGAPELDRLEAIFREVCAVEFSEDGMSFAPETVHAEPIREQAFYDGIRVTLTAYLGTARIPVQVDVGFGDATDPPPETITLPTLLDHPAPTMRAYRREVTLAEKLHAIMDLGMANSRMKDYFDIWFLSQKFGFDGRELATAIRTTFQKRRSPLPSGVPVGLSTTFATEDAKLAQWKAFVGRTRLAVEARPLEEVVQIIRSFLLPVLADLVRGIEFEGTWVAGGPWIRAGDAGTATPPP